ncbi:FAD binding domain protein [Mycobacterium avium MAV_120809_2495]|nr:FAD binding domain protein [Mycobacterium avium MAV_120809_2495]
MSDTNYDAIVVGAGHNGLTAAAILQRAAIVVGAGHNGLTAAAILQRAGLRTVCLEANTYAGGMAATVELIDGFRYEIAGSVQFPMAAQLAKDLGLDTLPAVEPDVMSTNIGEHGEER